MWLAIQRDSGHGRCATEGCYGVPVWRREHDEDAGNYCTNCRAVIDLREDRDRWHAAYGGG
jgi:hypothetical protein